MFTLYNVVSSDGFISRKDGSEDFIPDSLWPSFLGLCREYGAVVLGRKAYQAMQKYDEKLISAFEALPVQKIVISGRIEFSPKDGYLLVRSPDDALHIAPDALVSSGPTLNNYLLENGFVKKIILRKVPVAVGEGIRPFNESDVPDGIERIVVK